MRGLRRRKVALTRLEKERLTGSRLKILSVARSLKEIDPKKVRGFSEIEDCLEDAGERLKEARPGSPPDEGGSI